MIEIITPIFYKVLYMSVLGTILGILAMVITKIFNTKITAKWKCFILIIPLLLLVIPINRIEINTKSNIPISQTIDKFEESINNNYDFLNTNNKEEITENQSNVAIEKVTQSNNLNKLIPIVWFIGLCVYAISFIIKNMMLMFKVKRLKKVDYCRVNDILNSCTNKLKVKKKIKLCLLDENTSPCIYGLIHPKILLPKDFLLKEDDIVKNVFLHEVSHYKRKDMITNFILITMMAIHWFNPFTYIFFRRIRQEIECATDEVVLRDMSKNEKKQYGFTLVSLLQTCENKKEIVKTLCVVDSNKNMEQRIKMIKRTGTNIYLKRIVGIVSLIVIIICSLPFIIKTSAYENNVISASNSIEGKWVPYMAKKNEEEIPLSYIYGSGVTEYGGSLNVNEDGTYTEFIGVYSPDIIDSKMGEYEKIDDNVITLISNSGDTKEFVMLENVNTEGKTAVLKSERNNEYIYFKK